MSFEYDDDDDSIPAAAADVVRCNLVEKIGGVLRSIIVAMWDSDFEKFCLDDGQAQQHRGNGGWELYCHANAMTAVRQERHIARLERELYDLSFRINIIEKSL